MRRIRHSRRNVVKNWEATHIFFRVVMQDTMRMCSFLHTHMGTYSRMHIGSCVVAAVSAIAAFGITYRCLKQLQTKLDGLIQRLESRTLTDNSPDCGTLMCSRACATSDFQTTVGSDGDFLYIRNYEQDDESSFVLDDKLAGEWCYDKKLVVVTEDMKISEVLQQMHDAKSTCALLYTTESNLLGVLETPDIIRFLLRSSAMTNTISARRLIRQCVVAHTQVSVREICKNLCAGMRYIAVCSSQGGHQIVSQRAMVTALFQASNDDTQLEGKLTKTVMDGLDMPPVISCEDSMSAREAFQIMSAYGLTSLPILDFNGYARGVISATDILYARNNIHLLDEKVIPFVSSSRKDADIPRSVNSIVSCRKNDNLLTVLRIMMHEEVHHTYVLENNKPIGAVSFVDILRIICIP